MIQTQPSTNVLMIKLIITGLRFEQSRSNITFHIFSTNTAPPHVTLLLISQAAALLVTLQRCGYISETGLINSHRAG